MDANATLSSQPAGSVTPPAKPAASIHPQRKESHGKACTEAQSQAQPVQEEALLVSDNNVCGPINEPHILRLIRIFEEWRSALEYTGI